MRKSPTAPSQSPTPAGRPCVATSNCPYHFFLCQLSPANSGFQFDTVPYRAARRLVGTAAGVGEDVAEGSIKIVVGKGSSNKKPTATEQVAAWVNTPPRDTKAHAVTAPRDEGLDLALPWASMMPKTMKRHHRLCRTCR